MKIETIADIVAEKRNRADEIERDVAEKMKRGEMISDQFAREVVAYLRKEADRIEAAAKREREVGAEAAQICGEIGEMIGREATTEKSSRVGNAAAMREALETISKCDTSKEEDCYTLYRVCEAALSAKPRNCDMLSKDEVLETLKDRSFSKEDTIEWLYDKAEGENDGSK